MDADSTAGAESVKVATGDSGAFSFGWDTRNYSTPGIAPKFPRTRETAGFGCDFAHVSLPMILPSPLAQAKP
jgi:hypothetical protein